MAKRLMVCYFGEQDPYLQQDQVNNAKSAFILIIILISPCYQYQSEMIGSVCRRQYRLVLGGTWSEKGDTG